MSSESKRTVRFHRFSKSFDVPVRDDVDDAELQDRPSTPHVVKRARLMRGPAPVKLPTADEGQALSSESSQQKQPPGAFPHLPTIVRSTSSKLSRKFSRRSNTADNGHSAPSTSSGRQGGLMEFDKLETLAPAAGGHSLPHRGQNRAYSSHSVIGRRSSLRAHSEKNNVHAHDHSHSYGLFDFFKRRGGSSPPRVQSASGVFANKRSAEAKDELSKRKKSDNTALPMQPRSPRCTGRDRQASLPEIERLIKLSRQKRGEEKSPYPDPPPPPCPSRDIDNVLGVDLRRLKIDV